MKKVIAILMIVLIAATSVFCVTANAAQANANQPAIAAESHTNYRSNSAVYQALYNTIKNSGAEGYTVCKLSGSNYYHLILSYGKYEAARYYEVYRINKNDLTYIGKLAGAHTTAYIDWTTCTLGMFDAHMGSYAYGHVWADCGLVVETSGQVAAGQSYPSVPGEVIDFTPINNFALIANF